MNEEALFAAALERASGPQQDAFLEAACGGDLALRRRVENICSYEIETSILAHPAVVECAVIAVPASSEAGEDEVMAYVITGGDAPVPSAAELWAHCEGRIPSFAVPRYLRFVEDLPKTPSQRVQKARLRALGVTADTHDREG